MLQHLKEGVRDWLRADDERQLTEISLEYAYKDLFDATAGFRKDYRLGAGACGAVYRGVLSGGTEVAIKVLQHNGGTNGFEDEVRVLSRFRHPNLVTLLGWGQKGEQEKFLIYELLRGGDVSDALEKSRNHKAPFLWQDRLKVALDAACGLSHMMNSTPKAFHRDIKPANILLNSDGGAKMADFGLAGTIRDPDGEHIKVDTIAGTPGYCCPRYVTTNRVTEQSEVYSFGIVLLELLVNKPPALQGPEGDIVYPLLSIVQPSAPGAAERLLANLDVTAGWPRGNVADQFAEVALQCVDSPERRPLFQRLVLVLRRLLSIAGNFATSAPSLPRQSHNSSGNVLAGPGRQSKAMAPVMHHSQLAEVVLQCVYADGVELSEIPETHRSIALMVDTSRGHWGSPVGREHQLVLFESLAKDKEKLSSVSRTHFELSVNPDDSLITLTRRSGNPLIVDGVPAGQHEVIPLQEGSQIGFSGTSETDLCFLEFRLYLRSRQQVQREGPHPAARQGLSNRQQQQQQQQQQPHIQNAKSFSAAASRRTNPARGAVLECISSIGAPDLASLPSEARTIQLPWQEALEIGRSVQLGFFEHLLEAAPNWLGFVSRQHCRVQLIQSDDSDSIRLRVENLSVNPVFVSGRPVPKGRTEILADGALLAFKAKAKDERETTFLELRLSRPTLRT